MDGKKRKQKPESLARLLSNTSKTEPQNPLVPSSAGLSKQPRKTTKRKPRDETLLESWLRPETQLEIFRRYMLAILPVVINARSMPRKTDEDEYDDLTDELASGPGMNAEFTLDERAQRVKLATLYAIEAMEQERWLAASPHMLEDSHAWLCRKKQESTANFERAVELLRQQRGRFYRRMIYNDGTNEQGIAAQECDDFDLESFYSKWREMIAQGKDSKRFSLQIVDARTHHVIMRHRMDPDGKITATLRAAGALPTTAPKIITSNLQQRQQKERAR